MERHACYCMTRNIYHKVIPSLKSLLEHSSVDRVWLVTEDDDVGFPLPDKVTVINVADQKFFPPDGPNYSQHWTYMALMRTVLCHILPETVERALAIDLDTIVVADIDDLWDVPLGDTHYFAGVREPRLSDRHGGAYINGGVIVWNLKKMRKDGKADEIVKELNTNPHAYPEQDVMNQLCRGHIYELSNAYNSGKATVTGTHPYPRIYHFADQPGWYEKNPLVQTYKEKEWPKKR